MTIDSILKQFQYFGVNLGLERIHRLLAELGNPQQRVPLIHVAGTNGKGSVCAYLSAILTQAGYRVGRYTSPHLVDWTERICINDVPISRDELEDCLLRVKRAIAPDAPSPTLFEVVTAAAWVYFAQQQVDVAVMEVGLGGRLDATNACDRPLVSIITSISWEHWQRLGPTLGDIAGEKAGILKPGCPAVIGQLPPEAMSVVKKRIAELGCPAIFPEPAIPKGEGEAKGSAVGMPIALPRVSYQGIEYPLPLHGAVQLHNSALAIAALQILREQGWQISDPAIARGMANTQWPGRLQWIEWRDRSFAIDGAHNAAAAQVLRDYVAKVSPTQPVTWVMGMLSTKDHEGIFKALLRPQDRLYLVPVPDRSSADPEDLATLAQSICPELAQVRCYADVFLALEKAIQDLDKLPILCGSLYLLGHFLARIQQS
ncbi:bifunctional folylpolyglutamate synthase/dihydrofolate synthase [Phormidium sp. CCY1219]|uniref:bifunctional folylpolyglutamate synthase/dihydrofolate synthase n=1 Tax=Phormidium sp. CCY1219 TaxID=2886104 RepID=UPI002D1F8F76|nr:folylpolyglutamate synthase/dihydrofolate synthase family protein [Phormidium sp. CCY1219]MEB3827318.1 bifunctional folylpolyglutamate synthase/dihydrofolate synthase [Phormidium sp. CCY1219]